MLCPAYSLENATYRQKSRFVVGFQRANFKAGESADLSWNIENAPQNSSITAPDFAALAPDGKTFFHDSGLKNSVTFAQKGDWKGWFSFAVDGQKYVAPIDIAVR